MTQLSHFMGQKFQKSSASKKLLSYTSSPGDASKLSSLIKFWITCFSPWSGILLHSPPLSPHTFFLKDERISLFSFYLPLFPLCPVFQPSWISGNVSVEITQKALFFFLQSMYMHTWKCRGGEDTKQWTAVASCKIQEQKQWNYAELPKHFTY